MSTVKVKDATRKKIKARLALAHELLEESDRLPGADGYNHGEHEWWLHPRHTREALVIYLLLTCFDLLGQPEGDYVSFEDWLNSEDEYHVRERESALNDQQTIEQAAIALANKHQEIYAVKKSFYQGLDRIPQGIKERFFESITVRHCPNYDPAVSMPNYDVSDPVELMEKRSRHLYRKRNSFTHSLEQYHRLSCPSYLQSGGVGAAWRAFIRKDKLEYANGHQDLVGDGRNGKYVFQFDNWPFILFEALYSAIGETFEAQDIDLKFLVNVFSDNHLKHVEINDVDHKSLVGFDKNPSFHTLKSQLNR